MKDPVLEVIDMMRNAERPVILLGPVDRATAKRVARLARLLGAALLLTPDATSLVPRAETLGTFSFGAGAAARTVVALSDRVLALCSLSEFQCRSGKGLEGRTVIQVTSDPTDVGRNLTPAAALVGDIHEITSTLLAALRLRIEENRKPWFREHLPFGPVWRSPARPGVIHPATAVEAIEAALPKRCRVCYDVTSGALHAYERLGPTAGQRVFSSIEASACMGEALMASIGVRLASKRPTLVITGDWCQCMTPAEIHCAVEHGIGAYVVVVWSNGGGAFIGEGIKQQGIRVTREAWSWRHQPDFALMARAFGARGVRVSDAATLEEAVSEGMRSSRPTLIDAAIDPTVPVPAEDRFLTLSQAHG